mgnify:CR=1 FL=1
MTGKFFPRDFFYNKQTQLPSFTSAGQSFVEGLPLGPAANRTIDATLSSSDECEQSLQALQRNCPPPSNSNGLFSAQESRGATGSFLAKAQPKANAKRARSGR